MAYIGRDTDKISNVEVLDNITFDGSSSYTLQKNSVNFTPSSANTLLVSIDGVVQAGNFTVSGSTIDFGAAVAGTSTCDFILHYGIGLITVPADGSVTSAKLASGVGGVAGITSSADATAITIDSSENVLVGKTSSDRNTIGTELFSTGRTIITRDGGTPLDINRKTSDGGGITFYKDNTNVGEIEITGSGIGITLGGTGTANKLDDYEEGTWTPGVVGFTTSSSNGYYRKIGSQVTVWFNYTSTTNLGAGGAYYDLTGLPFTPTHYGGSFGLVKYHTNTLGRGVVVSCNSYETTKFRIQVFNTSATGNVDASYDDTLTGMATFFID